MAEDQKAKPLLDKTVGGLSDSAKEFLWLLLQLEPEKMSRFINRNEFADRFQDFKQESMNALRELAYNRSFLKNKTMKAKSFASSGLRPCLRCSNT